MKSTESGTYIDPEIQCREEGVFPLMSCFHMRSAVLVLTTQLWLMCHSPRDFIVYLCMHVLYGHLHIIKNYLASCGD